MLGVLALRRVLVWRVGKDLRTIAVETSLERRPFRRTEWHHIANNDCLWEDVQHHHLGSLWGADSRYQIDSELEGRRGVFHMSLPTTTFAKKGKKRDLLNPQMVKSMEIE